MQAKTNQGYFKSLFKMEFEDVYGMPSKTSRKMYDRTMHGFLIGFHQNKTAYPWTLNTSHIEIHLNRASAVV